MRLKKQGDKVKQNWEETLRLAWREVRFSAGEELKSFGFSGNVQLAELCPGHLFALAFTAFGALGAHCMATGSSRTPFPSPLGHPKETRSP